MRWVWLSFGLAVVASVTLLVVPLGTSVEAVQAGPGAAFGRVTRVSLLEEEGWWVAGLLAGPTVVAGAPLVARRRWAKPTRIIAAVLLGALVLIGLASVGLFYAPSAIAMVVAAARSPAPPVSIPT